MSILFALNFVGFVGVAMLLLAAPRVLGARAWLADALLAAFTVTRIVAWLNHGAPNPVGLGYIDKGIEVVLLGALAEHLKDAWSRRRSSVSPTPIVAA